MDMLLRVLPQRLVRRQELRIHLVQSTVNRHLPINAPPSLQSMPWRAEQRRTVVRKPLKGAVLPHNLLEASIPPERCILLDFLQPTQLLRSFKASDLDHLDEAHLVRRLWM